MDTTEPRDAERFVYFVESSPRQIRIVTIAVMVLIVVAVFAPIPLFRVLGLTFAVGPALWLLVEWLRRGRGVLLGSDYLLIEHPYIRRTQRIDYVDIHSHTITKAGGLGIAYRKPLAKAQVQVAGDRKPHPSVITTIRLNDPVTLEAELAARLEARPPGVEAIPPDVLLKWIGRRRVRNLIIGVGLFILTPLLALILLQVLYSFLGIGGSSVGR